MNLTKPAAEYTSAERRAVWVSLYQEARSKLAPSMPNRVSGQQIAAAKAQATKQMKRAGF